MAALVGEPSRRDPRIDFALGGRGFQGEIRRAQIVGDVPFNVFARAISAARINLNLTRRAHATVDDPAQAAEMGARARERVLDEHTYGHRARLMLRLLELETAVPA